MQSIKRAKWSIPALLLLIISVSSDASGQSLDINSPSPVRTGELSGRILARDIGDARFTDHYYTFVGNPGDLLITLESKNLNGDIDVFTVGVLRPLMKFSVYAENSAPVTKGIFLRKREALILRVQARSPNDDEGTYQIRFAGSFEPVAGPELAEGEGTSEESQATTVRSGDKKVRRVTSSGARIYEPGPPPAEVAAVPTPEPTSEATAESTNAETPSSKTEKSVESPKVTTPRNSRTRRPTNRRTVRTRPPAETARTPEETATGTEQPENENRETSSSSSRRSSSRRGTTPKTETPAEPQEEIGPRLVIETRDGTLINRSMTTVRRVMVENGQVVVVSKDGRVQRIRLEDVVRMTIAP
jgi:hypothetical protein